MGTHHCHPLGQLPETPLGVLSHGRHSLRLQKGAIFTRTGDGGFKGGPRTIALCGLSHLAPRQAQAETSRGEHQEKEAVAPCWQAAGMAMG